LENEGESVDEGDRARLRRKKGKQRARTLSNGDVDSSDWDMMLQRLRQISPTILLDEDEMPGMPLPNTVIPFWPPEEMRVDEVQFKSVYLQITLLLP
jgi:hypothetical protein